MRYALALLALIGCAEVPDVAVDEQQLAACPVPVETEVVATYETETLARLFEDEPPDLAPDPGECSQLTINGRTKSELCWTASATQADIASCLQDLLDEIEDPARAQFCVALIENHDVTTCVDNDITLTHTFRDSSCKLVTTKNRDKRKSCTRLSDDATVPHPTQCITVLDGSFINKKLGDVNNCPRCSRCSTAPGAQL